jgi:hypothetical protein
MPCPKCGFENGEGAVECGGCGVILSKATDFQPRFVRRTVAVEELERIGDGRIGVAEWRVMGIGLALALVAYLIPLTRAAFCALISLFHEFGHAVAGWLLGYVSIPAFDFVYGGGFTHMGAFQKPIAFAVAAGLGYLIWLFRENRTTVTLIGVLAALWLVAVTREWRREIVIASAGHLAEFILAGIFFYKALAGVGWRIPEIERPLGAFIAFFVQINSTRFAWRLTHDPDYLAWYREGKGGALMNDLEVVALDLQIWLGFAPQIEGVARALLVFSVVPTIVALVWYFERARWHRVLRALRTADA